MKIMLRLITLIKPLLGVMLLAIMLGLLGHLAATLITILGTSALMISLNETSLLSVKSILILMILCAVFRGILRYIEQASNH